MRNLPLLGLAISLGGCSKPSFNEDPNTGQSTGGSAETGDDGGSDEGGVADTSDTHTGGQDTDVAGSGGEEGSGSDTGDGSDDGGGDSGGSDTGEPGPVMMADFQLEDLNPMSPRYGEVISPRDYMEEISGWYFIKGS